MTTAYGKVRFGKADDDEAAWFAYAGEPTFAFASSKVSQENALMILCDILANKLHNVKMVIEKNDDRFTE
jgi:hypothetical protein